MRSVLLLAYHYPPLGGVAVMRVLRFSRYLSEHGWKPIVVCVQGGPRHEPRDPQLVEEIPSDVLVERVPCFEPDNFSNSWDQPAQKIVRNLFKTFDFTLFPDDRAFWVRPVVRRVKALVGRHRPALIWATAQPWSTLLAGARCKQATGLPLVLDFRDDWTTSNADFRRTKRLAAEQKLEQQILSQADAVIAVTPQIVDALRDRRPADLSPDRFHYIPNGFDPAHFAQRLPATQPFTILHAGGLYDRRPVKPLLEVLQAWFEQHPERRSQVRVKLAGPTTPGMEQDITSSGLGDVIELMGFLSHQQVRRLMMESSLNLLMIEQVPSAAWLFTGKVFEYLGARRPILMLGPDPSPLADMLRDSGLGSVHSYQDPAATARQLEHQYQNRGNLEQLAQSAKVDAYDARRQCAELAKVFQEVVSP
jgi:glycosyltransferase involved in cell wall biosynthesis